jgi:hypothetical protein
VAVGRAGLGRHAAAAGPRRPRRRLAGSGRQGQRRSLDRGDGDGLLARIAYHARDKGDGRLAAVFDDLLAIPDIVPGAEELTDTAREARALALTWLSGDFDAGRFVALYEDDEAQAAAIAEYRQRPRG